MRNVNCGGIFVVRENDPITVWFLTVKQMAQAAVFWSPRSPLRALVQAEDRFLHAVEPARRLWLGVGPDMVKELVGRVGQGWRSLNRSLSNYFDP